MLLVYHPPWSVVVGLWIIRVARVEVLLQIDTKLLPYGCEFPDVLIVLTFVFNLRFDSCVTR